MRLPWERALLLFARKYHRSAPGLHFRSEACLGSEGSQNSGNTQTLSTHRTLNTQDLWPKLFDDPAARVRYLAVSENPVPQDLSDVRS